MTARRPKKGNRITQTQARTALRLVLVQACSIDSLNPDSLASSYRVPRGEIVALLAEEQLRRRAR